MSRPNPCLNLSTACGIVKVLKSFSPRDRISSRRASWMGSEGTRNGSRVKMTHSSARPFTSTPSQKLSVPKSTLWTPALNFSRISVRLRSPCATGSIPSDLRAGSSAA